jgi:hypothetical protein
MNPIGAVGGQQQIFGRYSAGRLAVLISAFDLGGELARHTEIAHLLRQHLALLQDVDRARYVALGKKVAGLAKDLGIAMTFLGGSHEIRNH